MPLDSDLAQALVPERRARDPGPAHRHRNLDHLRGRLGPARRSQVEADHPDAVVVFIGANDGFPMTGPEGREIECCSAGWAAIYANRARQMMNTYRQAGAARVYWMTLPTPREPARHGSRASSTPRSAVAAQPWAAQVRVIDTVPIFTPGFAYRDAMTVEGKQTIVRQADGIHLNEAGSQPARHLRDGCAAQADFTY